MYPGAVSVLATLRHFVRLLPVTVAVVPQGAKRAGKSTGVSLQEEVAHVRWMCRDGTQVRDLPLVRLRSMDG